MQKITTLILILLFVSLTTPAQTSDSTFVHRKHEVGFNVGVATGMGLAYRYWPKRVGIQIVGSPVGIENLAITGLYRFYEKRSSCFFGYLGNAFYDSFRNKDISKIDPNQPLPSLNEMTEHYISYSVGMGPGFSFGRKVRFNIMAGIMFQQINNKENFVVTPTAELGVFYRF